MYEFLCVCGKLVRSRWLKGRCPHCLRLFELQWQGEVKAAPAAKTPRVTLRMI